MIGTEPLGPILHSFFVDHLITVKGLRPASVRSYRDTIRLFLQFAAADKHCKITRLALADLTFERVVGFLKDLESKGVLEQPLIHEKTADETKLDELRFQLGELQTKYTPEHPTLLAMKRQIGDLERAIASQPK